MVGGFMGREGGVVTDVPGFWSVNGVKVTLLTLMLASITLVIVTTGDNANSVDFGRLVKV
jgi:hypothetical protein